jgi:hypothetical protein
MTKAEATRIIEVASHALDVLDQVGVAPNDAGRVVMRLRALVAWAAHQSK